MKWTRPWAAWLRCATMRVQSVHPCSHRRRVEGNQRCASWSSTWQSVGCTRWEGRREESSSDASACLGMPGCPFWRRCPQDASAWQPGAARSTGRDVAAHMATWCSAGHPHACSRRSRRTKRQPRCRGKGGSGDTAPQAFCAAQARRPARQPGPPARARAAYGRADGPGHAVHGPRHA